VVDLGQHGVLRSGQGHDGRGGDAVEQAGAHLGIGDAEAFAGSEHQHAQLALVRVVVHRHTASRVSSNADDGRQHRMDAALGDEAVRLPRLR